jgi:hypothetical protein
VHDLRGTLETLSLANGKSESWISDRTGHRSSQMIARYKRTARTFTELDLGELDSLSEAIPELLIGPGLGQEKQARSETSTISVGHLGVEPRTNGLRIHCSTS